MQNAPINAAMALTRHGWRRIVLIAASLVLAIALIASLGTPSTQVSATADTEDGTELVAGRWKQPTSDTSDGGWVGDSMFARGPSWT